jgi:hypothetical protein
MCGIIVYVYVNEKPNKRCLDTSGVVCKKAENGVPGTDVREPLIIMHV